jgi:serine/threonine protein kinase
VRINIFLFEACKQVLLVGQCFRFEQLFFSGINTDLFIQRANILKEVQIMRQLDHPNIVKLVDFSESKQYYYIILELAPGGELFHQIVRLTYFSEDLSRHVITQVAEALKYLHEDKGVVHRYDYFLVY